MIWEQQTCSTWNHVIKFAVVCCFLVVYYTEAGVSENEASAEHETSQLYKYYTFLLLSRFYQCYGINTAIDILYEYKWLLLFFTRHSGVNDVFWVGKLDSVFSISLLHRDLKPDSTDENQTVEQWQRSFVIMPNPKQEVRLLWPSSKNYWSCESLQMLNGYFRSVISRSWLNYLSYKRDNSLTKPQ